MNSIAQGFAKQITARSLSLITFLAIAAAANAQEPQDCPIPIPAPAHYLIEGAAVAVDGATLKISKATVALASIYTPSIETSCIDTDGSQSNCIESARDFLEEAIEHAGGTVRCFVTDAPDSNVDRLYFGYCGAPSSGAQCLELDLGAELVSNGHAVLWEYWQAAFSKPYQRAVSAAARRKGLFKYKVVLPLSELSERINQAHVGRDTMAESRPTESPCPPYPGYNYVVLEGRPRVVDGTTLKFPGTELKLQGVFAPGIGSRCLSQDDRAIDCGEVSRAKLESKVLSASSGVRCLAFSLDTEQGDENQWFGYCGTPSASSICLQRDFGQELATEGFVLRWDRDVNFQNELHEASSVQGTLEMKSGLLGYRWIVPVDQLFLNAVDWSTDHASLSEVRALIELLNTPN